MSMVYLTRRVTFSAAHRLWSDHLSDYENYRIYDKCANPNGHGHNYVLEVTARGEADAHTGMVMNLTDMKQIVNEQVVGWVDHKHLNYDVPWLEGVVPTAEMLAIKFWERLDRAFPAGLLYEVKLHETENNIATYRGER
jgi:6-pyruvoyltetrahydropterin/6-carboxytetrahydropterin synthase